MSHCVSRAFVAAACLVWLAGCESATRTSEWLRGPAAPAAPETTASTPETKPAAPEAATASASVPEATGTIPTGAIKTPVAVPLTTVPEAYPPGPWSAAQDPFDDLALGKRHYREENYGLAEMHFRRVTEKENVPAQRKAEAWVGLAAAYDRLKRFELADRAYQAAIAIVGPTPEILNNQGFSYMLRGDYRRARAKLTEALALDPTNPYIQNNLELLEKSMRGGGGRKKV
jgi:Flp pilus assembly protein TadD